MVLYIMFYYIISYYNVLYYYNIICYIISYYVIYDWPRSAPTSAASTRAAAAPEQRGGRAAWLCRYHSRN